MRLNRLVKIQLAIFCAVSVVAVAVMIVDYIQVPTRWFGFERYTVTVELPEAAGLYDNANVTYRGTEVGQVADVGLTEAGTVRAVLRLRADVSIPANVQAQVHSVSGIGEQYVALQPRTAAAAPALKNGDDIALADVTVPPDVNTLLNAANRGLQAIPPDNLKTVIDESATAVGGLGPELARIVKGSTELAHDARANLDPITTLIDKSGPVLESQADTAESIQAWAAHLASLTHEVREHDAAFTGLLRNGGTAADQARQLVERLQPTLPLLLANLVTVGQVALAYQPAIEQLLVLLPAGTANVQGALVANQNLPPKYRGVYLDFNLNLGVPPPCTTGFLPAQQARGGVNVDSPDRAPGDLYCRVPQDAPYNTVRGARNYPCVAYPGKRAPTVKMCESNQQYVPLNDGNNWKGDPNATLSGQDVPQLPPASNAAAAPVPSTGDQPPLPIAIAQYDPGTGSYIGPDGGVYTQSDIAATAKGKTWQNMLAPASAP